MSEDTEYLQGKNILIVDDDPRNIFALSSYLENIGLYIHTAENGLQAIDFLQNNRDIDIILMDMMMPEMDGYEATEIIKKNKETAHIPIIAVTAKAMKGDREKTLEAGADEYVSKPVNIAELLEKMAKVLNQS